MEKVSYFIPKKKIGVAKIELLFITGIQKIDMT